MSDQVIMLFLYLIEVKQECLSHCRSYQLNVHAFRSLLSFSCVAAATARRISGCAWVIWIVTVACCWFVCFHIYFICLLKRYIQQICRPLFNDALTVLYEVILVMSARIYFHTLPANSIDAEPLWHDKY